MMTDKKLVKVLWRYYKEAGSYRRAAVRWGISAMYFYDILHGRRGLSDSMLRKMGYRRITRIIKKLIPL